MVFKFSRYLLGWIGYFAYLGIAAQEVSVIVPAYNSERFIEQAIESVLAQSFEDFEVIIVNDASTDKTPEIIRRLAQRDSRIKVLKHSENQGPGMARNTAIQVARGRYLAFLDADDLWMSHKLETQLAFIKETNSPFVYSAFRIIHESTGQQGEKISPNQSSKLQSIIRLNNILPSTVLLDTQKTPHLRFSEGLGEDLNLWVELALQGIIGKGQDVELAQYRRHPGELSSNKLLMAKARWRILRQSLGLGGLQAMGPFTSYVALTSRKHILQFRACRFLLKQSSSTR